MYRPLTMNFGNEIDGAFSPKRKFTHPKKAAGKTFGSGDPKSPKKSTTFERKQKNNPISKRKLMTRPKPSLERCIIPSTESKHLSSRRAYMTTLPARPHATSSNPWIVRVLDPRRRLQRRGDYPGLHRYQAQGE